MDVLHYYVTLAQEKERPVFCPVLRFCKGSDMLISKLNAGFHGTHATSLYCSYS